MGPRRTKAARAASQPLAAITGPLYGGGTDSENQSHPQITKITSKGRAKVGGSAGAETRGVATKKKTRRRQSEATKARKRSLSAKAKRASLSNDLSNETEDDENMSNIKLPNGAPKPKKVHNDELKNEGLEWEVEKLLESRINAKGHREYKVKWVGWGEKSATWEPEVNLRNSTDKIADFDEEFPEAP